MTEALVDVQEVNRSFHGAGSVVHAVRDVSLQVYSGEFVALRGRSGSGKTTLLNLIAGLDRPDSGSVYLEGEEISSAGESRLTELRRHSIGFVFQSFALLPLFSARENVELALRIAGCTAAPPRSGRTRRSTSSDSDRARTTAPTNSPAASSSASRSRARSPTGPRC